MTSPHSHGSVFIRHPDQEAHTNDMKTQAKTTRQDIGLKPGTDFSFHRVPPCLVPRYWSNDPRDLELSLGLDLHREYTSFPQNFAPVLSYMGEAGWSGWLICDGSGFDQDFYLVLSDDQVFRLDTSIELLPLLVIMKEQTKDTIAKDGEMAFALKWLLEHPDLVWQQMDQDEWMERCTQATS